MQLLGFLSPAQDLFRDPRVLSDFLWARSMGSCLLERALTDVTLRWMWFMIAF